ncbi:MAG: hypothetical protein OSA42_08750, partial [Porticoccaceae bacterium]|nr:hypothetical protein [Porticoccaceae bacterium]
RQIFSGYRLFPSNIFAWHALNGNRDIQELCALWPKENWAEVGAKFNQRMSGLPEEHRDIAMQSYAAPVIDQLSVASCRG